MKLELKHLTHYLPYKLKVSVSQFNQEAQIKEVIGIVSDEIKGEKTITFWCNDACGYYLSKFDIKPILRKLSSITNVELEQIGYDEETLEEMIIHKTIPFDILQLLLELHIDVFELIPRGLAIDINKI